MLVSLAPWAATSGRAPRRSAAVDARKRELFVHMSVRRETQTVGVEKRRPVPVMAEQWKRAKHLPRQINEASRVVGR